MSVRSSGILLHPSSLPSEHGIGDLGSWARRFADFLEASGQSLWQVLPLNPTEGGHGHSPYHSPSAFAGNPLLVSVQELFELGLLQKGETRAAVDDASGRVDFDRVIRVKQRLLRRACERFNSDREKSGFERFCRRSAWLEDFVLFTVLRRHHRRPWFEWPRALRDRKPDALADARRRFENPIQDEKILQYFFYRQWSTLKSYCNQRQIRLVGDMPIYVPLDSADVWAHRRCFNLTASGRAAAVSGVPPDYFSANGQLWGHPVYDWEELKKQGFGWWVARMKHHQDLYDITRIDHFRGLVAYWEVPARAKTAVKGRWVSVPVEDFFNQLLRRLGPLQVIAEDLGTITADVREILSRYEFPGMRVLLFAFNDDFPHGAFLPHNHQRRCVVYTGTHDNNTVRGWFEEEADSRAKRNLFRYLGRQVPVDRLHWELVRMAMMSQAETAIIPFQDVLGLGAEARMNRPAHRRGNWRWRFAADALDPERADRMRELTETYGRR